MTLEKDICVYVFIYIYVYIYMYIILYYITARSPMVRMTKTSVNCNMSEMFVQLCCGSQRRTSCYLDPLPLKHLVLPKKGVKKSREPGEIITKYKFESSFLLVPRV